MLRNDSIGKIKRIYDNVSMKKKMLCNLSPNEIMSENILIPNKSVCICEFYSFAYIIDK